MDCGGGSPIARIFVDRIINLPGLNGENIFGQLNDHPPYQTQITLKQTCSIIIPYHVVKLTESQSSIGGCKDYIQCKFLHSCSQKKMQTSVLNTQLI